ncbi:MAG: AgmX/PglI C-terminal domain-containing protein [Bdellovibrionota bacterium]
MMRLELLDNEDKVLATHRLGEGLTLLGQSPGAHVHLSGKGIGPIHVGIKIQNNKPVIMDLGGPTRLKINGKTAIEAELSEAQAVLEIGSRRVRVCQAASPLPELRKQKWLPVTDSKDKSVVIRVRLYVKGIPEEVLNVQNTFTLDKRFGLESSFRMLWKQGKQVMAQLPAEWISAGGRIQSGSTILKLEEWAKPTTLELGTVYRVFSGKYVVEILVSQGALIIGSPRIEVLPKELRKPLGASIAAVGLLFAFWFLLFGRPDAEVEEPYPVYARIQNIPVEKIFEPEPSQDQGGGGSGSESAQTTAPTQGAAASAQSKLAQALTGGLKSLVGNVLSNSKASNAVVSETGVGQVAAGMAGAETKAAQLAAVGSGATAIAGATKLGKLAIAGSGQGFSGGSGTGLGKGSGTGIGSGVGQGIGRGSYKLVEEESIVDGGLDKSVIEAVIRNNLGQIKYCYERQLVAEPDLFGKVVVLWQINANGSVEAQSIKQTTLNSPPVEQCMLGKISGWKFPQPKNGTRVTVSYPFLFKSTK